MIEILGYVAALLIGIVMGLTGSGGSILALPLLVGLFGMSPFEAVGASLFVVAATSAFGATLVLKDRQADSRSLSWFGLPSTLSIIAVRRLVIPQMPEVVFGVHRDLLVVLVFAAVMVMSSIALLRQRERSPGTRPPTALMIQGLLVGAVAGFVGAGGGFMIVPALVLFAGLDMKRAAGTSIVLIALNTGIGFLASLGTQQFDWPKLLAISGIAMVGLIGGRAVAGRIDQKTMKVGFAYFVIATAIGLVVQVASRQ